jgi:UDP-glucose 4-epimerase
VRLAESLFLACLKWKPKCVINASSISVYPIGATPLLKEDVPPAPSSDYAIGKLAAEHVLSLARSTGARVTSLRLSSLYGPGQPANSVLPLFVARAKAGQPLTLFGNGQRTQDFLHLDDACKGLILAAESTNEGVYNLGSGIATPMAELARIVTSQPEWGVPIQQDPRPDPSPSVRLDVSKAQRDLGFQPSVTLESGLAGFWQAG